MNQNQKQEIIDRHKTAFKSFGHHPNSLLWSDIKIQYLRFEQLCKIGIKNKDSIIDIGCGFADLYHYLNQQGINTDYTGLDICDDFINKAKSIYPQANLLISDVSSLDYNNNQFDYALLSGTLNYVLDDADNYAHSTINKMFDISAKGIAFNLLDSSDSWSKSRADLQTYNKNEIENLVRKLTKKYQIIDNYLENDFTVLAWK